MPTVLFSFFLRLFLCYIYFSLPVAVCIFSFYIATSSCTHNLPVCMNPLGFFFFGGGVHRCGCCYLNRFPSLFRHGNVSLKVWHYKLIFIPSQTVIANVNLKNFHLKLWADGVWKMFADQKNFAELQGGIHSLKMRCYRGTCHLDLEFFLCADPTSSQSHVLLHSPLSVVVPSLWDLVEPLCRTHRPVLHFPRQAAVYG